MSQEASQTVKTLPDLLPDLENGRYNCLWDLVAETISQYPDKPAYYNLGSTISYRQLDRLSAQFCACLQRDFNVQKGDRIALMLPNILAHPVCMFGILRAGAIVVNINPLFTARELQLQLQEAATRIIIVLENFTSALPDIIDDTPIEHVITVKTGDLHSSARGWAINMVARYIKGLRPARGINGIPFSRCLSHQSNATKPVDIQREDTAYLQFTGGTTGTPKAAMLTHGNIIANTLQAHACFTHALELKNPHVITALPLYHIFALTANCFVVIRLGGCSHLITNPRDINSFMNELKRIQPHVITGVDTLFSSMLKHPDFKDIDFSHLQLTLAGGMSVHETTATRWQRLTGRPIIEAYGLTEASPAITTNPVDNSKYTGKIGLPLPSTEISIRDVNDNPVGINEPGELWVKGPQVMSGYWRNPQATAEVLTSDGWLKTGDIVTMDESGYLQIIDRKKDLIVISGFNVYPNEIEEVLSCHAGILEAGVVGIPSTEGNEIIKAVIVKKQPGLTEEQVMEYCRSCLTAYKVPHAIEFRDELPKSNVGKILRKELR